ncbi:MAG: hypothetical protein ACKVRP_09935 [Bacteroidota bacterium]
MQAFITNIRGNQGSVESELRLFVSYRNEAAHNEVNNLLGKKELLEYCQLIEILCRILDEKVTHWALSSRLSNGSANRLGFVSEKFSNNIVVAKIKNATLTVGDRVYAMGKKSCFSSVILSIQMNNVSQQSVGITDETEVGIKFDKEVLEKMELVSA